MLLPAKPDPGLALLSARLLLAVPDVPVLLNTGWPEGRQG